MFLNSKKKIFKDIQSQKQFLAVFCSVPSSKFLSEADLQINLQPVNFHTFSPFIIDLHLHKWNGTWLLSLELNVQVPSRVTESLKSRILEN